MVGGAGVLAHRIDPTVPFFGRAIRKTGQERSLEDKTNWRFLHRDGISVAEVPLPPLSPLSVGEIYSAAFGAASPRGE